MWEPSGLPLEDIELRYLFPITQALLHKCTICVILGWIFIGLEMDITMFSKIITSYSEILKLL